MFPLDLRGLQIFRLSKFLRCASILISHIWVALFYWGDEIKEGAKDCVCRSHGEGEDCCKLYVGKPE